MSILSGLLLTVVLCTGPLCPPPHRRRRRRPSPPQCQYSAAHYSAVVSTVSRRLLFIRRTKLMKICHLPVDKIFPSNVMFCTFDTLLQLGCPCFAAEQLLNGLAEKKIMYLYCCCYFIQQIVFFLQCTVIWWC